MVVLIKNYFFYSVKVAHDFLEFLFSNKTFASRVISLCLKVVSATFLLICFGCIKESTLKTRKNIFYFTSKALFVLEIIKFKLSRYSDVMTSSNAPARNMKHILLNNLRSKHSLVMKFDQFM